MKLHLMRNKTTKKLHVMKTINKAKVDKKKLNELMENFKEVLLIIDCPFAEKFYYSFQTEKKICLISEYIEGGDFVGLLAAKGKLNENYVRLYSAEITLLLEHLHQKNIIYRDLKTQNIMLDENGHIKVIEFEFAVNMEKENFDGVCGSVEYSAPEVLREFKYSKASDLWSLVKFAYK